MSEAATQPPSWRVIAIASTAASESSSAPGRRTSICRLRSVARPVDRRRRQRPCSRLDGLVPSAAPARRRQSRPARTALGRRVDACFGTVVAAGAAGRSPAPTSTVAAVCSPAVAQREPGAHRRDRHEDERERERRAPPREGPAPARGLLLERAHARAQRGRRRRRAGSQLPDEPLETRLPLRFGEGAAQQLLEPVRSDQVRRGHRRPSSLRALPAPARAAWSRPSGRCRARRRPPRRPGRARSAAPAPRARRR